MELSDWARRILEADTLRGKSLDPGTLEDSRPGLIWVEPTHPARPDCLKPSARHGRPADRLAPPVDGRLGDSIQRGRLLHFFANHELLALECMALALLRFPQADTGWRLGLARTMREEQVHLGGYLTRMEALGVAFGDLPVGDHFWGVSKDCVTPLEFVTLMSLTLEQANLDHAIHFRDRMLQVGDTDTATLLQQVLDDEVRHVGHGVTWFGRWRILEAHPEGESDWEAYCRLLKAPLSPVRARGKGFYEEPRRRAGLSEDFIRRLRLAGGSRGRPRTVWLHDPVCELRLAHPGGFSPSAHLRRMVQDVRHLPAFLADPQDVVIVEELPRLEWMESLTAAGMVWPDFLVRDPERPLAGKNGLDDEVLGGLEPWGWSPHVAHVLGPLATKLGFVAGSNGAWCRDLLGGGGVVRLAAFHGKPWAARFLDDWLRAHPEAHWALGPSRIVGRVMDDLPSAREVITELLTHGPVAVKAPWGTSGSGVRRLSAVTELEGSFLRWIGGVIDRQGSIVVEPWLDVVCELSMQVFVAGQSSRALGIRRFVTTGQHGYRGTWLGPQLVGVPDQVRRFMHEHIHCHGTNPLALWHSLVDDLGRALASEGFRGPAGVDALVHRLPDGSLALKPLGELNPRWTMGRVALELEKRFMPGRRGAWLHLTVRSVVRDHGSVDAFVKSVQQRWPVVLESGPDGPRLAAGALFTNDPHTAREVLTVLVAGEETTLDDWMNPGGSR